VLEAGWASKSMHDILMTNGPLLSSFCHTDGRKGKDGQGIKRHIIPFVLMETTNDGKHFLDVLLEWERHTFKNLSYKIL
jgi:hypothetical protein